MRFSELDNTYNRRLLDPPAAFICDIHRTERFFNGFYIRFLLNMAWSMRGFPALHKLGGLSKKLSEQTWRIIMDVQKQCLPLCFILWTKRDVLGTYYTVLDSFADHLPSIVSATCCTVLRQVKRSVISCARRDAKKSLQLEGARHF